jgi:hypothetical protein
MPIPLRISLGTILLLAVLAIAMPGQDAKPGASKPADARAAEKPAETIAASSPKNRGGTCIQCHSDPDMKELQPRIYVSADTLASDIHWQKGLVCADCHGGDPTADKTDKSHVGLHSIKTPDIPQFCGPCHANIQYMKHYLPSPRTDQLAEYWTSGHGQHLKAGDTKVAVCTSCHSHHGIRAVSDMESPVYHTRLAKTCATCHSDAKLMAGRTYHGRELGHNQYEEWRESIHGHALLDKGDLSAPTCNNCHGNHGALPPQVDSVANACGSCHGKVAKLFSDTLMKHRFEQVGLPGCITCHTSGRRDHLIRQPTDEMLGMTETAVCIRCHQPGKQVPATAGIAPVKVLAGAEAAREMRAALDDLKQQIQTAETTVAEAGRRGMEVGGPRFDIRKAKDALTTARVLIHGFDPNPVKQQVGEGLTVASEVQASARAALDEYSFRRVWLAWSLVPIAIVIVLLLLYIRTLPVKS